MEVVAPRLPRSYRRLELVLVLVLLLYGATTATTVTVAIQPTLLDATQARVLSSSLESSAAPEGEGGEKVWVVTPVVAATVMLFHW